MASGITSSPERIISSLKHGRVLFFGPHWGVVAVDVKDGKPVFVQSTWAVGAGELERVRAWGRCKFRVVEDARPDPAPRRLRNIDECPDRVNIPSFYPEILATLFSGQVEQYAQDEWISLQRVMESTAEKRGAFLVLFSAEGMPQGEAVVDSGRVLAARYGQRFNAGALDALYQDNLTVPMEVVIISARAERSWLWTATLVYVAEPSLMGQVSMVSPAQLISSLSPTGALVYRAGPRAGALLLDEEKALHVSGAGPETMSPGELARVLSSLGQDARFWLYRG